MLQSDGCISQVHNETNARIFNRNIPTQVLQPYLSVRPVMTKYSFLPIVDPRKQVKTRLVQVPTYNMAETFNPGNAVAPWAGYASNVNLESELRSQVFAIQKCNQSVYVPSSDSDLYKTRNIHLSNLEPKEHSLLFKHESFNSFNPNPDSRILGAGIFMNSTRTQVKELGENVCNKK